MCKISLPHYAKCCEHRKSWAPLPAPGFLDSGEEAVTESCLSKGIPHLLHVCNMFALYVHHEAVHTALYAVYPVTWHHCVSHSRDLTGMLCVTWEKRRHLVSVEAKLMYKAGTAGSMARFGFTFMSHPGTHKDDESVQETRSENQPRRPEGGLPLQVPFPQRNAQLPPLPFLRIALERGTSREKGAMCSCCSSCALQGDKK